MKRKKTESLSSENGCPAEIKIKEHIPNYITIKRTNYS